MRSEFWRHGVAVGSAVVFACVLVLLLAATGLLGVEEAGGRSVPGPSASAALTVFDVYGPAYSAPAVLASFAFYGPAYLLLSQWAWRNVTGEDFRSELLKTNPPSKGLLRELLLGTPTQMASTAALLSLGAVYFVAIRPGTSMAVMLISLACVCGSWLLVTGSFSIEYAREWASHEGFAFPGADALTYGDFVYLAIQTSTTYSSSDVTTQNRRARRLVTIHSITAFVFATVILAFLVALVLNTVST